MNKMKNFKRRFSLSVPRTETIEESLTEFAEQFNQHHNRDHEGEGTAPPQPLLALDHADHTPHPTPHTVTAGLGGGQREDGDFPPGQRGREGS